MKKHLLTLALLCASIASFAQMSLKGEVRPRTELYNGNNTGLASKDQRFGVATQQRSRLYFGYDSDNLKIMFSPQFIHFWGQKPQAFDLLGDGAPTGPEPNFTIFEAYAQYKFSDMYSLKTGRQAISYGDERWFGALGWAASGRAHDAFVNKLSFGDVKLDVGLALNQTKHVNAYDSAANANIRAGYKSLQYAWLTAPLGDLTIDAMITNYIPVSALKGSPDYKNVTTFAILPTFKTEDLIVNASVYGQLNEANAGYGYLVATDVTYKGAGIPLTFGLDVVSGAASDDKASNSWLQPFGTNHKFYGFMDFFYVGENVKGDKGLTDIYAKAVIKTGEKTKFIVMPHLMKSTLAPEGIESDGFYGTEIDLVYSYQVAADVNFTFGYSKMFATSYMETLYKGDKGAGNQWAWMQLTFAPKFL